MQTRVQCVVDIEGRVGKRSRARCLTSRCCRLNSFGTMRSRMFQDSEEPDCEKVNEGGGGRGMKLSGGGEEIRC